VQEFWQLNVPEGRYDYRSVPDNCVDLIINITFPEEPTIVTPFTSSIVFEMKGPVSYFGIRFRILGHQGLISTPLGEWVDSEGIINASDFLSGHLLEAAQAGVGQSQGFHDRCDYYSRLLLNVVQCRKIDHRLERFVRYCHQNMTSNISFSDKQCSEFGISARQLRRLTQLYLGLSPREFAKVLRFQKTLQIMYADNTAVGWASHFYDQPHFIRNFKSMTGITPREFHRSSVLYNTERS
jgi:AraC-like DNA-binding protein